MNQKVREILQFISTLFFWVTMSLVIASVGPDLKWRYDTKRYFRVIEAVAPEPVVVICQDTHINLKTESELQDQGKMIVQLILLKVEGPEHQESIVTQDIPIYEGNHEQALEFTVPCNADPGRYKWKALINYPVKGYIHTEAFETNEFTAVLK